MNEIVLKVFLSCSRSKTITISILIPSDHPKKECPQVIICMDVMPQSRDLVDVDGYLEDFFEGIDLEDLYLHHMLEEIL